MLELSDKWAPRLVAQPETGMGYQICMVSLKDGRQFQGVTIVGGTISEVPGHLVIPFAESDIQDILVTHKG